ncbi:hypothetical protein SS50377_21117 [Spironucleus salmonicida]|uniref:Uncharacterized protein n=1 Tax=Spironucleus salmonicida TaxID=348837 RepID=V6LHW4_9EUKA|nr:hypothetical protein SS50377_21117 [Spironucleus salmonicida]|eukprot:EST43898.1 Hypothetical protein SS50377_16198 [Spironucleus salmonicida]
MDMFPKVDVSSKEILLAHIAKLQHLLLLEKDKNAVLLLDFNVYKQELVESKTTEHNTKIKELNQSWQEKIYSQTNITISQFQKDGNVLLFYGAEKLELELQLMTQKNNQTQKQFLKFQKDIQHVQQVNRELTCQLDACQQQCKVNIQNSVNIKRYTQLITKNKVQEDQIINYQKQIHIFQTKISTLKIENKHDKDKFLLNYKKLQATNKQVLNLQDMNKSQKYDNFVSQNRDSQLIQNYNKLLLTLDEKQHQIDKLQQLLLIQNKYQIENIQITNQLLKIQNENKELNAEIINLQHNNSLLDQLNKDIDESTHYKLQEYEKQLIAIKHDIQLSKNLLVKFSIKNQQMINQTLQYEQKIQIQQDNVFPVLQDLIKIFSIFPSNLKQQFYMKVSFSDIKNFIVSEKFLFQIQSTSIQKIQKDENLVKQTLLNQWTQNFEEKIKTILTINFNLQTEQRLVSKYMLYKTDNFDSLIIVWTISLFFFFVSGGRLDQQDNTLNFIIGNIEIFVIKNDI